MTIALIAVSLAFAWSMGAHYTGAVMGMPFAIRALSERRALVFIAVFCVLGATFASEPVQRTVGLHIVESARVTPLMALIMVAGAFVLTTVYTYYKIPTSTIQILATAAQGVQAAVVIAAVTQGFFTSMNQALVGAMAGAALANQRAINRGNLLGILKGWLISPVSGFLLCFVVYRIALLIG